MNGTTRLIYLRVKRLGGTEAMRRVRLHHDVCNGITRHRRRLGWALRGRSSALPPREGAYTR